MRVILHAVLGLILSSCNGSGSTDSNTQGTDDSKVGQGTASSIPLSSDEHVYTKDLTADPAFKFAASHSIKLNFDITEAKGQGGVLDICNDFSVDNGKYNVDYDSCTLKAELHHGIYQGEIKVSHGVHSIIAVVWLNDINLAPLYRVYNLDMDHAHSEQSQSERQSVMQKMEQVKTLTWDE